MLGSILNEKGIVYRNDQVTVVHIILNENEKIAPHDHKNQEVFFTVVKGKVEVYLNEEETNLMEPGNVLQFPGEARISAQAKAASEIFVYLVNR